MACLGHDQFAHRGLIQDTVDAVQRPAVLQRLGRQDHKFRLYPTVAYADLEAMQPSAVAIKEIGKAEGVVQRVVDCDRRTHSVAPTSSVPVISNVSA